MECVEICMEKKQISKKKKILDEIQMNFHINRIPNNSVILYAFSIVTQKL